MIDIINNREIKENKVCNSKKFINSIDLNDYTESGVYVCNSMKVAGIVINSPVNATFYLQVEQVSNTQNECIQILRQRCNDDIYYRVVKEVPTEWKKVATEDVLNEMISQIRLEISEKANKEELTNLEDRIKELLVNKVDVNALTELEEKIYNLISEKATAESLTDLEERLYKVLETKVNAEVFYNSEAIINEMLSKKADINSVTGLETRINNSLNEKVGLSEFVELKQKIASLEHELTQCYKLGRGTNLGAGEDLNNYLEVGNYWCHANVTVPKILNKPKDLSCAFTLKVLSGNGHRYPTQLILELTTGNNYYRYYNSDNNTWQGWRKTTPIAL